MDEKVVEVFSAKKGQSGMPRPKVEQLNLIEGFGIEFDKFAGDDLNKTVMIVGTSSYNLAKSKGITLELGSLGENILMTLNPHEYEIGTQFKIGNAIIEMTEKCTICSHLSKFDRKLPKIIKECRGIYCKIIKGAVIEKNQNIEIIKKDNE